MAINSDRSSEPPPPPVAGGVGTTVGGRSIPGLIVGNSGNCIALVGTIHAGESGPELMIPAVERLLAEHAGLLDQVGVALL